MALALTVRPLRMRIALGLVFFRGFLTTPADCTLVFCSFFAAFCCFLAWSARSPAIRQCVRLPVTAHAGRTPSAGLTLEGESMQSLARG